MHIPLANCDLYAQVDLEDADLAEVPWHRTTPPHIYAVRLAPKPGGGQRHERMHRVIALRMFGSIPDGATVDHRDGNKLNNRRGNLRLATKSEQMQNRRGRALGGTPSGYKGVSFHKRTGTWRAEMRVKGAYRHIGHFRSAEDAARAYDAEARERYGDYARCNFPLHSGAGSAAYAAEGTTQQP